MDGRSWGAGRFAVVARWVSVLCVTALLGGALAVPVTGLTAVRPAGAASVPPCPPDLRDSVMANCLPADRIPDDVERPADPVLGPPTPGPGSGQVSRTFTVTGPLVGDWCPSGPIPLSILPCTMRGLHHSLEVYDPNGTESRSLESFGITEKAATDDGCPASSQSCTRMLVYDPSRFTGTLTFIGFQGFTVVGDIDHDGNMLDLVGSYFTMTITGSGSEPPTARFTVRRGGPPGEFVFEATSTTPDGSPTSHQWTFGDGGGAAGTPVVHTYSAPGRYTVTLTSTDMYGGSDETSGVVTVDAPELGLSIDLLDGAAPPLPEGRAVRARVRVSASGDGVGAISGIGFPDGVVSVAPVGAFTIEDGPTPPVPAGGFSLGPGEERAFDVTLQPSIVGRYTLSTRVTGTDAAGRVQEATASSPGEIGQALGVGIELDPPFADQEEGPDGPVPVDVTATISFTNNTAAAMDPVTLTSLRVDRTEVGQLLAVEQTGGADPGDDGLVIGSLAPGETKKVTATFRATDDAEVEFSALATAATTGGRTEIGVGRARWSVKPKYLLEVTSRVTNPPSGQLLPAGELIRVAGTVRNLSNSATVEVGPLYPLLEGNAGVTSLAWDSTGTDPKELIPEGPLTLQPGESRDFRVRVLTSWSDPRRINGDNRSGGTSARVTFTPYGKATLVDGTEEAVTPDRIRAGEADLTHRVGIDDSIAIPTTDPLALAGAVSIGAIEGLWSATAAAVLGLKDLVKLPYTVITATAEIQSQVWASFTPEERERFANDTGLMAAAVLMRNAQMAGQGTAALWDRAKTVSLQAMTEMANEWEVGDYTSTARLYSRYGADAIGQVVVPIALAKMARTATVADALNRAQTALQERMASLLGRVPALERIEQVGPILGELASGTELRPDQLAKLYGITADELAEMQELARRYNVLLTVRSRHASSIDWIERAKAMLKPETLKIKSVSELDSRLGYRASDVGSLVFRKPEPLSAFERGEGNLGALINDFVTSKGFVEGTGEWESAVNRVMQRITEWRKWEGYYKRWDAQGWIDVSMNYTGNAITDPVRKGPSSLGVAPLESGKYAGFRLKAIGPDEYQVQMMNNKVGRFVPVTGDIDPIAFTHLDGSPLTVEEHAALLDAMAKNPVLQTQHGESATYVKGGVDFVVGQFKPGEPGLQIAPGGHLPRVVRLNPAKSRWENPEDYHLHWDGGFVYSGSYIPRTAIPRPALAPPPATEPLPTRPRAIPQATTPEPNVGRCRVTFGTTKDAVEAIMDIHGKLVKLAGDGTTTQASPLHDECFGEGLPVNVTVKPVTGLSADAPVGATELEIPEGDPWLATAGDGLQIGDLVTIGAGTPDAETHRIVAFGSIIIDRPLTHAHTAGELITVTQRAERPSTPPTPPHRPATPPGANRPAARPTSPPAPTGRGATTSRTGPLAYTGTNHTRPLATLGATLTALGLAAATGGRRRRRRRAGLTGPTRP